MFPQCKGRFKPLFTPISLPPRAPHIVLKLLQFVHLLISPDLSRFVLVEAAETQSPDIAARATIRMGAGVIRQAGTCASGHTPPTPNVIFKWLKSRAPMFITFNTDHELQDGAVEGQIGSSGEMHSLSCPRFCASGSNVFILIRWTVTPIPIPTRMSFIHHSDKANQAVYPIVSHNSATVSILCLSVTPFPSR